MKDKILDLWIATDGYKTYIVAAITVIYAVVVIGIVEGDWSGAVALILGGSGLGALRHSLPAKK